MKKCFKCGIEKDLSDFYIHPQMKDGHLNKCKDCCKKESKQREENLRKDLNWCEQERLRAKEKYHRLNYKDQQFEINQLKPYRSSKYSNQHRDLNLDKTKNSHHWNYNFIDDTIILDRKFHRTIHKYLILDRNSLCFKTVNGILLNTKKSHNEYIERIKINLPF